MRIIGVVFFLLFWMCIGSAAAEAPMRLEPIAVVAEGLNPAEERVEEIEIRREEKAVVSTAPDVLRHAAGIDVQRRSVLTPKSSQVRVRGLDERRTLILLDDRPLNGTGVMGGQFVDWTMLSLGNWRMMEVGKGAFSAKYGNTLGGFINFVPHPPQKVFSLGIKAGAKRYDTYSTDLVMAGGTETFSVRGAAGYLETDGNLRNSHVERGHVSGDFAWLWGGDGEVHLGFRYTEGDFQMPVANDENVRGYDPHYPESGGSYLIGPGILFPYGDRHGDNSYYHKERTELDLSIRKAFGGFDTEWKLYFNNEDRTDVIYSYAQGVRVLKRECVPDRSWGWKVTLGRPLGAHQVGLGLEGNYLGMGGVDNLYVRQGYFPRPPVEGDDEWDATRYHGVYVDDMWKVRDWLTVYGGLRYEDYYGNQSVDQVAGYSPKGWPTGFEKISVEFDESVLLPKFGVEIRPHRNFTLFGHVARAARMPDNPAFYWYYGGYRPEVDPNSDVVRKSLTYEDAIQYEAGFTFSGLPRTQVAFTYYNYRIDDYIRWIFGYSPSRVVYNIDRVDLQGVEIQAETNLRNTVFLFGNVSWQDSRKRGDVLDASNALSDELTELPEWKANAGVRVEIADRWMLQGTFRWVDTRKVPYLESPGAPYAGDSAPDGAPLGSPVVLKSMDSFSVVDVQMAYTVTEGPLKGTVRVGVENLFDEKYEEELHFPAPRRTFFVSAELQF